MEQTLSVQWLDSGREPECQPNPAYPDGCDLDASKGALLACTIELPYPARRCGVYVVRCRRCDHSVGVTTAGRLDDPRSLTLPCGKRITNVDKFGGQMAFRESFVRFDVRPHRPEPVT